jgi:hypothetical protein
MSTLKHIIVNIHVYDDVDIDPLFGISSKFEDMRTINIIETVTIKIMVQADASWRHGQEDDWGRLDKVFTTPGWFSLKRVSLAIFTIEIDSYRRGNLNDATELEVSLRDLLETQFPRLSSSNSVSFDFEVNRVTNDDQG